METRGRIAAAAGQQCEMPGFGIDMAKTWEPYDVLWWAFNVWLVRACPRRPDDVVQKSREGGGSGTRAKIFLHMTFSLALLVVLATPKAGKSNPSQAKGSAKQGTGIARHVSQLGFAAPRARRGRDSQVETTQPDCRRPAGSGGSASRKPHD